MKFEKFISNRIVHIWNSVPNTVVEVDTVKVAVSWLKILAANPNPNPNPMILSHETATLPFKSRLDKFLMYQDMKYDFTAELTGTGDRAECDIEDYY